MSAESKVQHVISERARVMSDSTARGRIALLLDSDSFVELDGFAEGGVVCGYGAVMGSPVAVFAQQGGVGAAHAAKVGKVYDFALKTGIPVVGIYDSRGANIGEGVGALAACGDMLRCVNNLSGVVPQISLVLGVCAGASAMLACSADFLIMSEGAGLFVATPEEGDAGTAAFAARSGAAHLVCADDAAACKQARALLGLLPLNNLAPAPIRDFTAPDGFEERLRAACETPGSTEMASLVADVCDAGSLLELLGDFGPAAYTALCTMAGFPCGVVAARGPLCSDACSKIAKLVSVCDAYQIPVLTFVDTEGLASSSEDELCGAIRDMARMAHVYAEATTAKLAVITGAAYGAAYIALAGRSAGADYTLAWPSAVISALPPRSAVALLCADEISADNPREAVEAAYVTDKASGFAAAAGGYVDDVIDPALTRPALLTALDLLSAKRVSQNPKKHGNIPL